MNKGILQNLPEQQMMARNPNLWNINDSFRPIITSQQQASPFLSTPNSNFLFPPYTTPTTSSFSSINPSNWQDSDHELPESWSQLLLMDGLVDGEDNKRDQMGQFESKNCMENWEEKMLGHAPDAPLVDVKQERSVNCSHVYGQGNEEYNIHVAKPSSWSQVLMPATSSTKTTSTLRSNSVLDFSNSKAQGRHHRPPDRSYECNSSGGGRPPKKARVQPSSSQTTLKVRKEKLGDRITALHQLVSPFGKTDTASVLLEAIGYIRILQCQIEALSLPYLGRASSGNMRQQESDSHEEPKKDLKSRGLCLAPLSCTLQIGGENGADFWAPAFGGCNFR